MIFVKGSNSLRKKLYYLAHGNMGSSFILMIIVPLIVEIAGGSWLYAVIGFPAFLIFSIVLQFFTGFAAFILNRKLINSGHPTPSFTQQKKNADPVIEAYELEKLQMLAKQDFLTSLYNRGAVESLIRQRLLELPGGPHFLIIADIDDFKKINDSFGHLSGDKILKQIAMLLRRVFHQDQPIGRIGGDEFIVFIESCYSLKRLEHQIQKLYELLDHLNSVSTKLPARTNDSPLSFSLGIACFPQDGLTYEELFEKADFSLYQAKRAGKNTWRIYDEQSKIIKTLAQ